MKKIIITFIAFIIASCAGSKMKVKPGKNEALTPNDTTLITVNEPKKIFADQIIEHTIDSVIIPKRNKKEKTPQIIVIPIALPITTYPVQIQEQKPEPKVELKPEVKKQEQIQVIPESKEEIKTTLTALQPEVKETKTSDITNPKLRLITQTTQFSIQIGAFITKNSAKEYFDKFTRLYPDKNAYIIYDSTSRLYKVYVDSASDLTKLLKTLEIIKENFPDAFITSTTLIQQVSDE